MMVGALPEDGSYTADKRNPVSRTDRAAADAAIKFEHLLDSSTDGDWSVSPIIGIGRKNGSIVPVAFIAIDMGASDKDGYREAVLDGIANLVESMR